MARIVGLKLLRFQALHKPQKILPGTECFRANMERSLLMRPSAQAHRYKGSFIHDDDEEPGTKNGFCYLVYCSLLDNLCVLVVVLEAGDANKLGTLLGVCTFTPVSVSVSFSFLTGLV